MRLCRSFANRAGSEQRPSRQAVGGGRLPCYIKLDRSFLSEHHTAESRSALIRSAEGIETADQHRLASEAGVDFVQGFGVARPMPMAQLLDWLQDQTPD